MKQHIPTVLWAGVLGVSLTAIGAGFAGGQSLQRAGAASLRPETLAHALPPMRPEPLERSLFGARGDADFDPVDAPVDDAVPTRPAGWAPDQAPALNDRVKLAIVVTELGYDRMMDERFARFPYPLTFALPVDATNDDAILSRDPDGLLVAADAAEPPATIAKRVATLNAGGVLTPVAGPRPAPGPLAAALDARFVVDGIDGDAAAYRAARRHHLRAATRDIVLDAREEPGYVAYMLGEAGRIARQTGVAVAVARARPSTYEALRNAVPLLDRNGIDVVPVGAIVR